MARKTYTGKLTKPCFEVDEVLHEIFKESKASLYKKYSSAREERKKASIKK